MLQTVGGGMSTLHNLTPSAINAYNFLQQTSSQYINEDDFHVFWHKVVPPKVNLFVWRLLLNRLPTNENLVKIGVLPDTSQQCVEDVVI